MDERLLPDGIRDERAERLLALLDAWDEIPLERALVYRVSEASPDALRQLAWQFHVMGVEGWGLAITRDQRERLVSRAMELHRYKGTPWAVRRALEALGLEAEIVEWFQAGADDLGPFEFALRATISEPIESGVLLNADTSDRLRPTIDAFKSARSHLVWIAFAVRLSVPMPAPELIGSRRVRRRTGLGVPILPTFDAWALDGARLDQRALEQFRKVAVVTTAPVRLGRASTLDQALRLDGDGLAGLAMDRWIPYREDGRIPPLARLGVTSAARTRAPAGGAAAAARPTARSRWLAPVTAEADHRPALTTRTAAALRRPEIRGLDHMPTLDAAPVDAAPLDIPMETANA